MSWRKVFKKSSSRRERLDDSSSCSSSSSSSCPGCSLDESQSIDSENIFRGATPAPSTANPESRAAAPHRSVLVRFSFLKDSNNTIPVRLTDLAGGYGMYHFLYLLSEAAIMLMCNPDTTVPFVVEHLRPVHAVIQAYFKVKIRWDLGGGLLGHTELPLVDAHETWDDVVKMLVGLGGRGGCVVVDLSEDKVEYLRRVVPAALKPNEEPKADEEEYPEYADECGSV